MANSTKLYYSALIGLKMIPSNPHEQTLIPITVDNYHQAFAIQTQCHLFPWSENVFADCLTDQYFAYQLALSDKIVGYFIGLIVADEATLMDIGVTEYARGHGLGRMLLDHFISCCAKRSVADIWLEVRESNTNAISLYNSVGFTLIELRKGYYPHKKDRENGLIMRKILS